MAVPDAAGAAECVHPITEVPRAARVDEYAQKASTWGSNEKEPGPLAGLFTCFILPILVTKASGTEKENNSEEAEDSHHPGAVQELGPDATGIVRPNDLSPHAINSTHLILHVSNC